jgi:hypothetical protein
MTIARRMTADGWTRLLKWNSPVGWFRAVEGMHVTVYDCGGFTISYSTTKMGPPSVLRSRDAALRSARRLAKKLAAPVRKKLRNP